MRLIERALCGYVWRLYHLLTATIYAQRFHSQPVSQSTPPGTEHANAICLLYSQCAASLSDFFLDAWSRPTRATNGRCLQKQVLGLCFPLDFVEKQPDAAFAFRHVQCVLSVCTALKDMHVFM